MIDHKVGLLLICFLSFFSCNNKPDQQTDEQDSTATEYSTSWQVDLNDSTGKLQFTEINTAGPDSLTATAMISFLNTQYPNVQVEFSKISNDTIYISIPESTYLTQQMGSTGPTIYFANVVYNLTELPGIRYVNFDFQEGDHALPGIYSRASFREE